MRPSFIAQIFSGLLILISLFFLIKFKFDDPFKSIILLLAFSIAIGIHGLQHSVEEIYYDFNPLDGKWKIRDNIK
jgi:hypothetical protein